jgi:hypothetical protein
VDTENCLPAHDLYVSVLQVECLVASRNPFAAVLSDILVEFVGVKSDMVEMLNVGEETVAIRSSVNGSGEGTTSCVTEEDSVSCKMGEGVAMLIMVGRSWGMKATGVSTSPGISSQPHPRVLQLPLRRHFVHSRHSAATTWHGAREVPGPRVSRFR